MLMQGRMGLKDTGRIRTSDDPMQIVSGPIHDPKVHFEAPPSGRVPAEMERFLKWFNGSRNTVPALARSAIAHVYFESIHPFEDGNGRIGRAVSELALSQSVGKPVLLALSKTISSKKKVYYSELGKGNRTLDVADWVGYFSATVLEAQERAGQRVVFLVEKAKFFDRFRDRLNSRQEKVLRRVFDEGPDGFAGGLSAGNYSSLTKASGATVTRDLVELVEMGALLRTGEKRYTRYRLNLPTSM
jgi:Fic family protein